MLAQSSLVFRRPPSAQGLKITPYSVRTVLCVKQSHDVAFPLVLSYQLSKFQIVRSVESQIFTQRMLDFKATLRFFLGVYFHEPDTKIRRQLRSKHFQC